MAQRIIRLGDLASYPARKEQPAQLGRKAKPAKPAKAGRLPVSAATIWRWVRDGKFPKPFKLGSSVTVWNEDEIDAFIAARVEEGLE